MSKRVRMQPDKRRLLIMEAAAGSFAERGFHATTMKDVATKSGISVGALYRYFDNKDALITAIIHQSYQMAFASFPDCDENNALGAKLEHIFGNVIEQPPTRTESALIAEVLAESFRNANVDKALRENEDEMEHWLQRQLENARENGQLDPDCNPSSIAVVINALYDGLVLRASTERSGDREEIAKIVRAVISTALTSH